MARLTVEIDEELKKSFRIEAIKEGKDLTEKVIELIQEYLRARSLGK